MIEGGWSYVVAAYVAALGALAALTIAVALRAVHWARKVRALDHKAKPPQS